MSRSKSRERRAGTCRLDHYGQRRDDGTRRTRRRRRRWMVEAVQGHGLSGLIISRPAQNPAGTMAPRRRPANVVRSGNAGNSSKATKPDNAKEDPKDAKAGKGKGGKDKGKDEPKVDEKPARPPPLFPVGYKSPVTLLNEKCQKLGWERPIIDTVSNGKRTDGAGRAVGTGSRADGRNPIPSRPPRRSRARSRCASASARMSTTSTQCAWSRTRRSRLRAPPWPSTILRRLRCSG